MLCTDNNTENLSNKKDNAFIGQKITQIPDLYQGGRKEKERRNFNAKSIYVYNLTDEEEIISVNDEKRLYPASLVKIMTVYVALNNVNDLSAFAPIDKGSYQRLVKMNSSMAGFVGREQTTYRDLLYGTILASGGECAESLAINISGSEDYFVNKMNDVALAIGLCDTHYENVTGLDREGQYQSAKDVAKLLKVCLNNDDFRVIFTKKEYISSKTLDHTEGLYIESTVFQKLKNYGYDGFEIIGGKSGTTDKAGLCLATLAVKDNKEYIVVVMGVPYDDINDTGDGQIEDTLNILKDM